MAKELTLSPLWLNTMALRKKKDEKQYEALSFEDAIKNLTEIVNQIETGQVPLAESLEKYEQGMGIIRHCRRILLDAEKRIQEVSEDQPQCPPAGDAATEQTNDEEEQEKQEEDENESLF